MDKATLKHYLHTELGIPLENLKDGMWTDEVYIEYTKPQLDPDSLHRVVMRIIIEVEEGLIIVTPDFLTGMGPTKYAKRNIHFDKRIRKATAKLVDIVKEEQIKQDNFVYERDLFKSKYHDLLTQYSKHIQLSTTLPIHARMSWFNSSYMVDLESEEVKLGFGDAAHVVPISAALDFLNECEVYKLLKG